MKFLWFYIPVILAMATFLPGSVNGQEPTTSNVSVTFSDNLTLDNVILDTSNVTATANVTAGIDADTIAAIDALIEDHDERFEDLLNSIMASFLTLLLVIVINVLAFQQRHVFLYCLCVPVDTVFGLTLAHENVIYTSGWVTGIIVAVIGTFCLFRVAIDQINEIKRKKKIDTKKE